MNPKVDIFFEKLMNWQNELLILRKIILETGLTEELKWGVPCYTFQKANVVIIHGFKDYCAIMYLKGALLQDSERILIQQTEHTQATRQIRFSKTEDIFNLKATINAYIYEAIEVEKAGLKVPSILLDKDNPLNEFVDELKTKFKENQDFKFAFEALTPGRQRAYNMFFSAPKQTQTRENRIEKYIQQILNGKGLHDCTCGFSKKMPSCDGSHKFL